MLYIAVLLVMSADYISILIMAMANGYDDGHGYGNACCYDSDMYNNQIQGGGWVLVLRLWATEGAPFKGFDRVERPA